MADRTQTHESSRAPVSAPPAAEELAMESTDGVDLSLIRWTLSLTPLQRLELLQEWVDGLAELRRGRVAAQ